MDENNRKAVNSTSIKLGKRTFFFDVNVASNSKKYLKITESRFIEEGQDRKRTSFVLFPEEISEFQSKLTESLGFLG